MAAMQPRDGIPVVIGPRWWKLYVKPPISMTSGVILGTELSLKEELMPNLIIKDKDRKAVVDFLRNDYKGPSKLATSSSGKVETSKASKSVANKSASVVTKKK